MTPDGCPEAYLESDGEPASTTTSLLCWCAGRDWLTGEAEGALGYLVSEATRLPRCEMGSGE